MSPELDKKLCERFPNLYKERRSGIRSSLMAFGFEIDDGWFQLIWDLSEKLENAIVLHVLKHPDDKYPPCAAQVKEKHAGLRFYMTTETDEMSKYIAEAERQSYFICEICGKPGQECVWAGWYKTLCPECAKQKNFKIFKEE